MTHDPQADRAREQADVEIEARLGLILDIGAKASTALLAAGLLWSLMSRASTGAAWLLTAGLVLLLATPVARVAASVVEYGRRRDWTFTVLTAIVLVELLAGVVAALVFHRRL
ncbi:MAG: DUF1634 domain-containing protein [Vicinamibacterales bacterium]